MWAWSRRVPDLFDEFHEQVDAGAIATCHPVILELLYSARGHDEFLRLRGELGVLVTCPIGPAQWDRAVAVYDLLAAQGPRHQRQVGHADLLIAAAAEAAGVPVLHYDEDFDRIAGVSGIATRWVRPRGSLGEAPGRG